MEAIAKEVVEVDFNERDQDGSYRFRLPEGRSVRAGDTVTAVDFEEESLDCEAVVRSFDSATGIGSVELLPTGVDGSQDPGHSSSEPLAWKGVVIFVSSSVNERFGTVEPIQRELFTHAHLGESQAKAERNTSAAVPRTAVPA